MKTKKILIKTNLTKDLLPNVFFYDRITNINTNKKDITLCQK